MIDRQTLLSRMQAARLAGRPDYVRLLATEWLATWPGDQDIQLSLAKSEADSRLHAAACQRLLHLVRIDPERVEAYQALAAALIACGDHVRASVYQACAAALCGEESGPVGFSSWSLALGKAIAAYRSAETDAVLREIQPCLATGPDLPIAAFIAMQAARAAGDTRQAVNLAKTGYSRWPECVAFRLCLAVDMLQHGEAAEGVDMLHRAAADDPTGRIARAFLGQTHPFLTLWPTTLTARCSRPLPAEVATVLGDNRLACAGPGRPRTSRGREDPAKGPGASHQPAGGDERAQPDDELASAAPSSTQELDPLPAPEEWEAFRGPQDTSAADASAEETDETLIDIRNQLDRLASRIQAPRPESGRDARVQAYIVLSSRTRMLQNLGEEGSASVDEAVTSLVNTIRRRRGWTAYRFYVDDPSTLESFGLAPADPTNAWQIKLRLSDLDQVLKQRGETIAALLIVGGDRTVPFHLLPNPVDDDDQAIPSDSPYASSDENYLAPEWPVGRLPFDQDASVLTQLVYRIRDDQLKACLPVSPFLRLRQWLMARFALPSWRRPRTFGYSASIWRKASMAVFRTIGETANMYTSPPIRAEALPTAAIKPTRMSYYNLHGVEDAPEWFGQSDPLREPQAQAEFPVALRPQDVVNAGRAPAVVFTEACFGANTLAKTVETALCMKFLASGSRAFIGSTRISYGSIATPLIAADLLGRLFWEQLSQQFAAGEALRRAKIRFAIEMHRRQGYLDGEDQKTLMSFVLYGDPLSRPLANSQSPSRKAALRPNGRSMRIKVACSVNGPALAKDTLDPGTFERVKAIVAQYLPGMADADCRVHPQRCGCAVADRVSLSQQAAAKAAQPQDSETLTVTFAKSIQAGQLSHTHFARLTLDPTGKVLKLAVSR